MFNILYDILGGVVSSSGTALSLETLLDILLVLYDECQTPALRREKRISEFIDFGKIFCYELQFCIKCY
jgi:serine/threonine-protein kinase MRCK